MTTPTGAQTRRSARELCKILRGPDPSASVDNWLLSAKKSKHSKYNNVKTEVDGIMFDSKREAAHWGQLVMRERAGSITDLQRQVRFELHVNGVKVCSYCADFTFWQGQRLIVADSKGMITPMYRLKKKMMDAEYGLEILEM